MLAITDASVLTAALQNSEVAASGVFGPASAQGPVTDTSSWHFRTASSQWFRVDWPSVPTAQQISAADAVIQETDVSSSGIAAATNLQQRSDAIAEATAADGTYKLARAILIAIMRNAVQQFNVLRDQIIGVTTVTIDPPSLANNSGVTSAAITVTGAAFGDSVDVCAPYDLQGIIASGYVSAANTVRVRLQNATGGAIDLTSGTWKVVVRRHANLPDIDLPTAIAAVKADVVAQINAGNAD